MTEPAMAAALTNLPVQSSGSEQRRVQHVWPVGSHDHLDLTKPVKPVHLVEQFHQCPLDLPIGRGSL